MFSEDDKNVTSIFEVPNIDKESDNTESDNYESDNDTITTTDAIADVTELNMLDELSISKPVLVRSIGHNKWIFGMCQLMKDSTLNNFVVHEINISGCQTLFGTICGKIWKYYVERDTLDKNKLYHITEEYSSDRTLINKNIYECTQNDYDHCNELLESLL